MSNILHSNSILNSKELTYELIDDPSRLDDDSYVQEDWIRPSDWIDIPTPNIGDEVINILFAVFQEGPNFLTLQASGTFSIDWGDGTTQSVSSGSYARKEFNWNGLSASTTTSENFRQAFVKITPLFPGTLTSVDFQNYHSYNSKYTEVNIMEIKMSAPKLTSITINNDVSNVNQFYKLRSFEFVGTHSVVDMSNLFSGCVGLKRVKIDLGGVANTSYMFSSCHDLTDFSITNTKSVVNMSYMFQYCYLLNCAHYTKDFVIDASSCTNMSYMFRNCHILIETPTILNSSKVVNMSYMFNECNNLKRVLAFSASSVTDMSYMFQNCHVLRNLPLLDTPNLQNMEGMFMNCYLLNCIPKFDTKNVTTMYRTFMSCGSLVSDIGDDFERGFPPLNTSKVQDMRETFRGCGLKRLPPINTANVNNMEAMFRDSNLEEIPLLNTSKVWNMSAMFSGCTYLKEVSNVEHSLGLTNSLYGAWNAEGRNNLTVKNAWNANGNAIDSKGGANGTIVTPDSTTGYTISSMTYSTGKLGTASFNFQNNFVLLPNNTFTFTSDFTVSLWFYVPGSYVSNVYLVSAFDNQSLHSSYNGWMIDYNTTNNNIGFNICRNDMGQYYSLGLTTSTSTIAKDRWNHVAITRKSNSRSRIYINGVLSTSNTSAINPTYNVGLSSIGSSFSSLSYPHWKASNDGLRIDALQTWEAELDQDAISELYYYTYGQEYPFGVSNALIVTPRDSVGTNHGVLQNGCSFSTGRIGNAFSFDGVDDYISLPINSLNSLTGDFSVSLWVKTNNIATVQSLVSNLLQTPVLRGWQIYMDGGVIKVAIADNTGSTQLSSVSSLSVGSWCHVVVTRKSSTGTKIYINGILSASNSDNRNPSNDTTMYPTIGINQYGSSNFSSPMDGSLDSVSIWNRELSQYEITQLCNTGSDIPIMDTGNVTNMSGMFFGCVSLKTVPLFNTKNVTTMYAMFRCQSGTNMALYSYNQGSLISVPKFNTQNVTDMGEMFYNQRFFSSYPEFNTSKVTNFSYMFYNCWSLKEVGNFSSTYSVSLYEMFKSCSNLRKIGYLNFPSGPRGSDMYSTFESCGRLESIAGITASPWRLSYTFKDCGRLREIPYFDTSGVNNWDMGDMYQTFKGCSSIITIPNFNFDNVYDFYETFKDCTSLKYIPYINTKHCTRFQSMFENCYHLEDVPIIDLSRSTHYYPSDRTRPTSINIHRMFDECHNIKSITFSNATASTTEFDATYAFRNCSNLEKVSMPNVTVTSVGYMFENCHNLLEIGTFSIYRPGGSNAWGGYDSIFKNCYKLNNITDLVFIGSPWSYDRMFQGCVSLTETPYFDMSAVGKTTDNMSGKPWNGAAVDYMFDGCDNLSKINIKGSTMRMTFNRNNLNYKNISDILRNLGTFSNVWRSGGTEMNSTPYNSINIYDNPGLPEMISIHKRKMVFEKGYTFSYVYTDNGSYTTYPWQNLPLYIQINDNNSYYGSGNTVSNISGYKYPDTTFLNGTLINSPIYNLDIVNYDDYVANSFDDLLPPGKSSNFEFNGVNQCITFGTPSTILSSGTIFTVFELTELPQAGKTHSIMGRYGSTSSNYFLDFTDGRLRFGFTQMGSNIIRHRTLNATFSVGVRYSIFARYYNWGSHICDIWVNDVLQTTSNNYSENISSFPGELRMAEDVKNVLSIAGDYYNNRNYSKIKVYAAGLYYKLIETWEVNELNYLFKRLYLL
jgi:surface protein